eukprot:jgi/Picre1/34574/NNA_002042.t1
MTVEEFGELEVRRMREEEQKKKNNLNRFAEKSAHESDDDDDDEERLAKVRAFDDFKDSHRRGSGNSKLRPTG